MYVTGDLNIILNPELDKKGGKKVHSRASNLVNTFLEEEEWVDVWRILHDNVFQFTWKGGKPLIMSRLDYMLAALGSFSKVCGAEITPATISDHCPLTIELNLSPNFRGPSYWKFNTRLLNDKAIVDELNQVIETSINKSKLLNPMNKWEKLKEYVKVASIELAQFIYLQNY